MPVAMLGPSARLMRATCARLLSTLPSSLEQQLAAAEPIMHLVQIPGAGRGLVAARDIEQGQVVLQEAPLLASPSPLALGCACHYCLRPLAQKQRSTAAAPTYCSDTCSSAAEAEFAAAEALCDFSELQAACRDSSEKFPLLAARAACLVAQQRWEQGRNGSGASVRISSSSSSSGGGGSSSGDGGCSSALHEAVWGDAAGRGDPAADLRHLCFANVRQAPQEWAAMHAALQRGMGPLARAGGQLSSQLAGCPDCGPEQLAAADWEAWLRQTFSLDWYVWTVSRLHLNVFRVDTIPPLDMAADPAALLRAAAAAVGGGAGGGGAGGGGGGEAAHHTGAAVYSLASMVNHSCSPCLDVTFPANNALLELVAARDVAAGEQLTISYVDAEQPRAARQQALAFAYGFECRCPKCEEEAVPQG